MPNSTVQWDPAPTKKRGMVFLNFIGNGSLYWNKREMHLVDQEFAHAYGELPRIDYKSLDTPLKVTADLIT